VVPRSPRSIIIGSLVAVTRLAGAQTDSNAGQTFYVQRDALVGTALFAVSAGVSLFDVRIARYFQDTTLRHVRVGRRLDGAFTRINETTLTVGGLVVYAAARIAKQRTLADAAFHVAESVAAASLTSQVIRGPLGRTRPQNAIPAYEDQYEFKFFKGFTRFANRAFPSIHSSSGFAAASAIISEVENHQGRAAWYVAVPSYALALTPGLSRMYLGQHWASDIISGAVIGTFYGQRIVRYAHAHPTTPVDRLFLGSVDRLRIARSRGRLSLSWGTTF